MYRPRLEILESELVSQIISEGILLLEDPGIKIHNQDALNLLAESGSKVDFEAQLAYIPENVVRKALSTAPHEFTLYDLKSNPVVHYYQDEIYFDPGSGGIAILDSQSERPRSPNTSDLIKFIKLVETLPQIDAQSTAFLCTDVIKEIGPGHADYIMHKHTVDNFRRVGWFPKITNRDK